jgi:hypothetical protein
MPAWVAAIRADNKVGIGSCSVIDECYTDAELERELNDAGIKGKIESVRWARNVDQLYREREQEVCAEIF